MTLKSISITDILAFVALFLFVGACSYVKDEREMVEEQETVEAPLRSNSDLVRQPEVVPLFSGCEDRACSDKELIQYIYKNLKYPDEARKNGVEGKVYVQFVIEKDGEVSNIEVVRGEGALAESAKNVVQSMNVLDQSWSPATEDGEKVRSKYTLPITFRLESKEI